MELPKSLWNIKSHIMVLYILMCEDFFLLSIPFSISLTDSLIYNIQVSFSDRLLFLFGNVLVLFCFVLLGITEFPVLVIFILYDVKLTNFTCYLDDSISIAFLDAESRIHFIDEKARNIGILGRLICNNGKDIWLLMWLLVYLSF